MASGFIKAAYVALLGRLPTSALGSARHAEKLMRMLQGKGGHLGGVEEEVRAAVRFLPERGAVVVDAGAHSGQWTRALLDLAGERIARIYAFEPSPTMAARIEELELPGVKVVKAGLSSRRGSSTLYATKIGSGGASLHRRDLRHRGRDHGSSQETVELITLDGFAAQHEIRRIDLLKMDIEGHELAALEGARSLLKAGRIHALSFEFSSANIDARTFFRDYWYELQDVGFSIWRIVPSGRLLKIEQYGSELESFFLTNYIAARPEAVR